jgi:hypothetical protein
MPAFDRPETKKPASADAGFLGSGRMLLVLALVAVPHWPRTIIRAQIIAVVGGDGGGQERGHGSTVPLFWPWRNCCGRNRFSP